MPSISVPRVIIKRRGIYRFKEPKTAHSRRRVAMTPKLALFLSKYLDKRESIYWQLGKPLTLDDIVFASLTLLRGAKPKVISEALGHTSAGFTMDVYSHIIEGMQKDVMALLDEVLPTGINSTQNIINANS